MTSSPANPRRREFAFRLLIGAATLLMLGLSWPLWISSGLFPRVPFLSGLPILPPWASLARFAAILALIAAGIPRPRLWLVASSLLLWAIAEDQHRFQVWAYVFMLTSLAIGLAPAPRSLACVRLLTVALYIHSGLSKLDASFARELGPVFLSGALRPFGIDPSQWPPSALHAASLVAPFLELSLGLGLTWCPTRSSSVVGLVLMHALLISILGPWGGLDHSPIVLLWNAAMASQSACLFWRWNGGWSDLWPHARADDLSPLSPQERVPAGRVRVRTLHLEAPLSFLVLALFALAVLLPVAERSRLWDTWPSFALYASHAERSIIEIHESSLGAYPDSVLRHLHPSSSPWRTIDLTRWSRLERGTPPYPQGRASLGVAESLALWGGQPRPVRLILWGPADRWTARRSRQEAIGPDAIHRLGSSYWWNPHPSSP